MSARVFGMAGLSALLLTLLGGAAPSLRNTRPARHHPGADTRCGTCHSTQSWSTVSFAHEKTGFPLRGAHQKTACKSCHLAGFDQPLSPSCVSCHPDVHRGDLGARCGSCHDETQWRTRFDADAHRRSNFPLSGRHALIPCEECHLGAAQRSFTRAALDCFACHQKDYDRAALSSIDHTAAGFSTNCRDCHGPFQFAGARFPGHDNCFQINGGRHAGIRCLTCHTQLGPIATTGACATGTAACTNCHEHTCAKTDSHHTQVPGYQCKDRKCYECHRFTSKP